MAEKGNYIKSIRASEALTWGLAILGLGFAYKIFKTFTFTGTEDSVLSEKICANINPDLLTYDPAFFASLADQLESLFFTSYGFTEDDEEIGARLMLMRSLEDITKLICVYDIRGRGVLIKEYYNLPQTVAKFLDSDVLEEVNQYYIDQGINFQF